MPTAGTRWNKADYGVALITSSGILEAIVTDALEYKGLDALAVRAKFPQERSLIGRSTIASPSRRRAGLIRGGCARLPEIARRYREIYRRRRQLAD